MRGPAVIVAIIVLAMLGAVLAARIFTPGALIGGEEAHLAYLVGWLAMLCAAVFMFGRMRVGMAVRSLLAWAGIALFLIAIYALRDDFHALYVEVRGHIIPAAPTAAPAMGRMSAPDAAANGAARLIRASDGHFWADAQVNGTRVRFLIDTGASAVALTEADARRVGLSPDSLRYTVPVSTANGTAWSAPVRLRGITIGDVRMDDVDALVAQGDRLEVSLLGMSFLGRLSRYEATPEALTLRR